MLYFYYGDSMKFKNKHFVYIIFIFLVSFIALFPKIIFPYLQVNDTAYHVGNIISSFDTLKNKFIIGDILPNIIGNYGYGTRLFYSNFSQTICTYIMKLLNVDVFISLKIFHLLTLFFSGVSMYYLCIRLFKDKKLSFLSSVIYLLFPFHISEMLFRDSIAEELLFIFIPIIILSYTYLFEDRKKFLFLFVFGYVCGMLSHLMMMVYFSFFSLIFYIFNYKKICNKKNLLSLLVACIFILLIMSPWLYTLLYFKINGNYLVFIDGIMANGIYKYTLYYHFFDYFHLKETLSFYFDFIVLFLIYIYIKNYKKIDFPLKKFITLFIVISFITTTKLFPWDLLPVSFRIIQFPFRNLVFVCVGVSIITGYSYKYISSKIKVSTIILFMLFFSFIFNVPTYFKSYNKVSLSNFNYSYALGNQKEYLPLNAYKNFSYISNNYEINVDSGKTKIIKDKVNYLVFSVSDDTKVELPRIFYYGYELKDVNGKIYKIKESSRGLIEANIKKGTYKLKYVGLKNRNYLYYISIISSLSLLIYVFKKNKQ